MTVAPADAAGPASTTGRRRSEARRDSVGQGDDPNGRGGAAVRHRDGELRSDLSLCEITHVSLGDSQVRRGNGGRLEPRRVGGQRDGRCRLVRDGVEQVVEVEALGGRVDECAP